MTSLLARTRVSVVSLVVLGCFTSLQASSDRGFAESNKDNNLALTVGVAHGLPGIDIDINNVNKIVADPAYNFKSETLMDAEGTVANVAKKLEANAKDVGPMGTFFFYYSGHGSRGSIYLQDRSMRIAEIRAALVAGRKDVGPLQRLVMVFDSCFSGSLMDPLRKFAGFNFDDQANSEDFANEIASEMNVRDADQYWSKLFVFASSTANESSLAGKDGSEFTNAFTKAFGESFSANNTIGEFIKKAQDYTKGHHPVARLVPTDLENEKMNP